MDDFIGETEYEHSYSVEDNNLGFWMLKMLFGALLTPIWIILEIFEVNYDFL